MTHTAWHFFAFEDLLRVHRADRADFADVAFEAVGVAGFVEVVALDSAGESFTFACAGDGDFVAELKSFDGDGVSGFCFGEGFKTKLPNMFASGAGLFEVACEWLAQSLTLTDPELHSVIPVGFDGFNLSHCGWVASEDSDRGHNTIFCDDLGHTNFGAEDDFHNSPFLYIK